MRNRSKCRIWVGPSVTLMLASERTCTILPELVTTGRLSIPCVLTILRFGPVSIKSMRLPSTVISMTRMPSLKASMVSASSRAVT